MTRRDDLPRYPRGPGHRGGATSRAGALKVHSDGTAQTQTSMVLAAILAAGPEGVTAIEIYNQLQDRIPDVHVVRARISPLFRDRKIADSGRVRDGGFGVRVKVWVAPQYAPPPPEDDQADMFGEAA